MTRHPTRSIVADTSEGLGWSGSDRVRTSLNPDRFGRAPGEPGPNLSEPVQQLLAGRRPLNLSRLWVGGSASRQKLAQAERRKRTLVVMAQARREEQFNRALTEHVHLGAGRHGPMVWRDNVPKRDGSAVAMTRCACGKSFAGHAWGPGDREWRIHNQSEHHKSWQSSTSTARTCAHTPEPVQSLRRPRPTPVRTVRTRREPGPRFVASWTGSDRFGPGSPGTCPNLSGFRDVRTRSEPDHPIPTQSDRR